MAQRGRMATSTAGAPGGREQPRASMLKVSDTSYHESYCERVHGEGGLTFNRQWQSTDNNINTLSVDPHMLNFASHLTRPTGTGFTANQRPAVYYSPNLDHVDNPQFGYMSENKSDRWSLYRAADWRDQMINITFGDLLLIWILICLLCLHIDTSEPD